MELSSDLVGTSLKNYETKIGWRSTTNYAAGIQDNNPKYFNDMSKDGIVSHPMFPVAVTWPVLSNLGDFIESADFPRDVLMTQVHYTEHIVLHRLVLPGDELVITGNLMAFIPHRAGTHAIICLKAEDKNGEPVFTEYVGAMLRGVDCGRGDKKGKIPIIPEQKTDSGNLWVSEVYIDHERPYIYDGCSNIEFPIHTSPNFAKMVGLPGIILQGTASLAYAVREILDKEARQDPEMVSEIACMFTGMVQPGTDIKVCCTGRKVNKDCTNIFFEVKNNIEKKAIRNGYIKLKKG